MVFVYVDCKSDGTPFYVGKGNMRRVKERGRRNQHHRNITAKHQGWYRGIAYMGDDAGARQKEMELIAAYGRTDNQTGILCNKTDGGDGSIGCIPNEQTREKMRNRYVPEEKKDFLRTLAKGRKRSEETKKRMGAWQIGKVTPESTKQKISASLTGKKYSEYICLECGKITGSKAWGTYHENKTNHAGKVEL